METQRNLRIRNAIHLALGVGIVSGLAAGPVIAAEDAAELERVQVTGSRISRLDVEGATPVVTISREDLDNSGFQSVADFLRSSSFNSFGSFREQSGTGAQGQATLNLRGIGSNRTLILIDGKRLPGSPVLDGQIQNLNTVPFAAVERIEILSDGASAVYGSDAIGGVVNIIMRKDFEGAEVTVRGTMPDRDGGDERGISIVSGFAGDRGHLTFALEADHQDTIMNTDRWFTSNQQTGTDPTDFQSFNNLSFYGRNVIDFSGGTFIAYPMISAQPILGSTLNAAGAIQASQDIANPSGACGLYGEGFWSEIQADSDFPDDPVTGIDGDYVCAYDYTGVAATTAQLDRLSAYMNADYEINSDLTFTSQLVATRVQSWGRYAPAAAPVVWNAAPLPLETITYQGNSYTLNPVDVGDKIYMRWNNTGVARDTWQNDYQFDLQVGLDGFYDGIQWNANYQFDQYDLHEWGNGYIQNLGVPAAAAMGWDPRHPDQAQFADALGQIDGNSNRRAEMRMQRVDVGAQFDGPMLRGGPVLFFVGGEYIDQDYYDETLAQMEAGNIGGTAGGSSGGGRSNWAVFGEASIPIGDTFEINPALRYDSYNDFGTNVSGKVSFRWQPVDYFVARGSFGTGFRAPSLDELYQAPSQSFAFADDLVGCQNAGKSIPDCLAGTDAQYETYFGNSPDLEAEESTQYLLGGVLDFNQLTDINLTLSLDYYYTEIENVITTITAQDAFWLEYLGQLDQYDRVSVTRLANGRHNISTVAPINFSSFDTSGLDFRANYGVSTRNVGDFSVGFQMSYILDYNEHDILGGPLVDVSDRNGQPQWRADLDLGWTMGRHTISWNSFFIPGQAESTDLNPNFDDLNPSTFFQVKRGSIDSYANHSIMYSYEAAWNARIQVGVNNLSDEDPVLDSEFAYDSALYPLVSRAYVVAYTQRF